MPTPSSLSWRASATSLPASGSRARLMPPKCTQRLFWRQPCGSCAASKCRSALSSPMKKYLGGSVRYTIASSGDLASRCTKRRSSPAASLACHSASPKTSWLMAPANAVGTPSLAMARATFQVEPPTLLCHCWLSAPSMIMSVRASPAAMKTGRLVMVFISVFQDVERFVAGAHGVVIDLAGRAFLVAQFAVVLAEHAIPRAVLVVDHVLPAVRPDALIPGPVLRVAAARGQQRGRGQALGLHPEIFVAVADAAVRREAVADAAVVLVPGDVHGRVEQLQGARQQPVGRAAQVLFVTFHDQQQLGPFGQVAGLVAPWAEDVGLVVAVVVAVDAPVGTVVFPNEAAGQSRLALRDVVGQRFGALQIGLVAGRFEGGQQRFAGVHIGVLAAIAGQLPVAVGVIGIQSIVGLPETLFHQGEGLFDVGAGRGFAGQQ